VTPPHDSSTDDGSNDKAKQRQRVVEERNRLHAGDRKADKQQVAGHVAREDMVEGKITIGVNHARRQSEHEQARGVPVVNREQCHHSKC